jgi:hypothetical protein
MTFSVQAKNDAASEAQVAAKLRPPGPLIAIGPYRDNNSINRSKV